MFHLLCPIWGDLFLVSANWRLVLAGGFLQIAAGPQSAAARATMPLRTPQTRRAQSARARDHPARRMHDDSRRVR